MPTAISRKIPMTRSTKFLTQTGCSSPGLAEFAQRFTEALGPVKDVAEVAALLGHQGRRINDAAKRRRIISARIALLADDGDRSAASSTESMGEDDAPVVVMLDSAPLAKPPLKTGQEVTPPATKPEFQIQALADVARLLSSEDIDVAEPVEDSAVTVTVGSADDPEPESEQADPEDISDAPQPSPQTDASAGPSARYTQESTRVMNVARDSNEVAPPKKKKKRQKPSDPIDFSALAQFGSDTVSQETDIPTETSVEEKSAPPTENQRAD